MFEKRNTNYRYMLNIANVLIEIHAEQPVEISKEFEPFICEQENANIVVDFRKVDDLETPAAAPILSTTIFKVYESQNAFCRIYYDPKEKDCAYAMSKILSDNYEIVQYIKDRVSFFYCMFNIFAYISFEDIMIRNKAMILHAAFIRSEYGGILFSGPSGIGKSTQADLWNKYCNAEILNGDRTIIREVDDMWRAYGSPYAGSSKYYKNQSAEIRCIVLLEQSEKCTICRLSSTDAFVGLYAEMIVNTWNSVYIEELTEILYKMVMCVPVYRFRCCKNREAVSFLKKYLDKEETDGE